MRTMPSALPPLPSTCVSTTTITFSLYAQGKRNGRTVVRGDHDHSDVEGGNAAILWFGHKPRTDGLNSVQAVTAGESAMLIANCSASLDAGADNLPADTSAPVAIVGILDDRVIPINGEAVWNGSTIPGQLNYLPITVRAPDEPGVHQLFLQQCPHPYTDVAEAETTRRSDFGVSSQRFIPDVEQAPAREGQQHRSPDHFLANRLHAGSSSTPGTTSSSETANSPSSGDLSTGSLAASSRCTLTPRPSMTSITRCSGSTIQYSRTPPRA